jgi:hypothetical protein
MHYLKSDLTCLDDSNHLRALRQKHLLTPHLNFDPLLLLAEPRTILQKQPIPSPSAYPGTALTPQKMRATAPTTMFQRIRNLFSGDRGGSALRISWIVRV